MTFLIEIGIALTPYLVFALRPLKYFAGINNPLNSCNGDGSLFSGTEQSVVFFCELQSPV